jgi:hypothetical protein
MTVITTTLYVAADGAISIADELPAGDYTAIIVAKTSPGGLGKPFTMEDFPIHEEPWDDSISLHREDLYDDEGRLR